MLSWEECHLKARRRQTAAVACGHLRLGNHGDLFRCLSRDLSYQFERFHKDPNIPTVCIHMLMTSCCTVDTAFGRRISA